MHADECKGSAVDFLQAAIAHYAALSARIERLLTDDGAAPSAPPGCHRS